MAVEVMTAVVKVSDWLEANGLVENAGGGSCGKGCDGS